MNGDEIQNNVMIPYRKSSKWAYANIDKQLKTNFIYDYCTMFSSGYAIIGILINEEMNFGIIDQNFDEVIKPIFWKIERSEFSDFHFNAYLSIGKDRFSCNYKSNCWFTLFINIEPNTPLILSGNFITQINKNLIIVEDAKEKIVCYNVFGKKIFEREVQDKLEDEEQEEDCRIFFNGVGTITDAGFLLNYNMHHNNYSYDEQLGELYDYYITSRDFYYDNEGQEITKEKFEQFPLVHLQILRQNKKAEHEAILKESGLIESKEYSDQGFTIYLYEKSTGSKFWEE
jgi:hypothetical protein